MIAKFVGYQSKVAKRINQAVMDCKHSFRHMPEWVNDSHHVSREVVREFNGAKGFRFNHYFRKLEEKIEKHKRIAEKREAFFKITGLGAKVLNKRILV